MSTLTGTKIKDTYPGLIKTADNAALGATEKNIEDGAGNASTLNMGTASASFTGTLDLSGATVTGLPSAAGLESGTGADSMQSAASLTTTAANASANDTIAIGGGASASSGANIAIGDNANAGGDDFFDRANIAIGRNTVANNERSIAIGLGPDATGDRAIAIGEDAQATGSKGIAIGASSKATNPQTVGIGEGAEATGIGAAAVGQYAEASAIYASAWGRTAYARSEGSVAFGQQAGVPFSPSGTEYVGAVAMGRQVVADTADTTHVRALKIVAPDGGTGGNGITMLSPNGTEGVITLTDTSQLALDGTPIGGGAAGLVSGTGTDSMISSSSLTTLPASADGPKDIALGSNVILGTSTFGERVAIGNDISNVGAYSIAIGRDLGTTTTKSTTILIGNNSWCASNSGITIGNGAQAGTLDEGMAIGLNADCNANSGGIAIGRDSTANNSSTTAIGRDSFADGFGAVALGYRADCRSGSGISVALGYDATVTGSEGVAIGGTSQATASQAIALGYGVVAGTANTATVNLFQIAGYASMNYADDTAAAAGGIPLGGVYHNAGALRIRIA